MGDSFAVENIAKEISFNKYEIKIVKIFIKFKFS